MILIHFNLLNKTTIVAVLCVAFSGCMASNNSLPIEMSEKSDEQEEASIEQLSINYNLSTIDVELELTGIYLTPQVKNNAHTSNCISLVAPSDGEFSSISITAAWDSKHPRSENLQFGFLHSKNDGNFTSGVLGSGESPLVIANSTINIIMRESNNIYFGFLPDSLGAAISLSINLLAEYKHSFEGEPTIEKVGCEFFERRG